ncbi:MAG: hypothetical protein KGS72_25005 [Cyanobacteria bacterium REEB67]|nr:hypothetical protein [Cyanobacteria bacterium REEB67]
MVATKSEKRVGDELDDVINERKADEGASQESQKSNQSGTEDAEGHNAGSKGEVSGNGAAVDTNQHVAPASQT